MTGIVHDEIDAYIDRLANRGDAALKAIEDQGRKEGWPIVRAAEGSLLHILAKAMGARDATIMRRHILPNAVGPIIVQASFGLGSGVLIIGGLSFLGLGVQPPTPEWGSMLSQGRRLMVAAPHLILWPGIALSLAVLSVNILGDALRYAYDPRFRGAD